MSLNFKNILIIRTDRIGDVVLTTPAIKALRQAYPGSRISILLVPATVDLVQGNPYIDEIIVDDRQGKNNGVLGFWRLVQALKSKHFDLAIVFHTKRRYNLAAFLAGVKLRLGYKNNKLGFLLNRPLKDFRHFGQRHEAECCMDVLRVIGAGNDELDVFVPLQKQAEEWAVNWMQENDVKPNEFIVIHPGASDPDKCWPTANFAQLMDHLSERYPFKIILIGSPQTAETINQILRQTKGSSEFLSLAGKTSLSQTASLLRRARLLISNDSGPVHLGAGVGCHVISLFLRNDPGINPERWKPLGPKGFVLGGTSVISVDDVLDASYQILQKDNQYEIF